MATLEESLTRDNAKAGLIVAMLLIMSFQVVALIPLIAIPLEALTTPGQVLFITNIPYLIAYLAIPLVYYVGVSLLFNPKRIVSPFYAQIGTIGIITMMLTYRVATTMSATLILLQNMIQTIAILVLFFIEVGYIQLRFVRWIVGLNFDTVDSLSFLVEGIPPDKLVAVLGDGFLNAWYFSKTYHNEKVWVLKKHDQRSKCSLIVAIGEQTGNPNNSLIATVGFQRGFHAIMKTDKASNIRNEIVNNIKGKLTSYDPKIEIKSIEQLNDDASTLAYTKALAITVSKLGIVTEKAKYIPLYYKILVVCTLLAIVGFSLLQVLGYGSYGDWVLTLLIALSLEIGIPLHDQLRDQLSKRKSES